MSSSDSSNPSIRSSLKQRWYQAREKGLKLSSPEVLHDGTTFKYYHTKNDLHIFVKGTDETSIVRGEGICENMNAQEFMETFLTNDMNVRKQFDPHTMRSDIVEKWHDEEGDWFVQYFASPSLAMVSSRDFINIYRIESFPQDNELIFTSTSVPEGYQLPSNFQPVKGAVRGENIFSTLRLKQLENGDLKMVNVNQAKPNGWIPFSIINASIYGVPQVLRQTALYLRKILRHLTKYEEGSTNLK